MFGPREMGYVAKACLGSYLSSIRSPPPHSQLGIPCFTYCDPCLASSRGGCEKNLP